MVGFVLFDLRVGVDDMGERLAVFQNDGAILGRCGQVSSHGLFMRWMENQVCITLGDIEIDALDWDDWNLPHAEAHGYSWLDAQFICFGEHVYYTASYKERHVILGPARDGRILAVILGKVPNKEGDVYYVFSLRPAKRKERAFYERKRQDTDEGQTS